MAGPRRKDVTWKPLQTRLTTTEYRQAARVAEQEMLSLAAYIRRLVVRDLAARKNDRTEG